MYFIAACSLALRPLFSKALPSWLVCRFSTVVEKFRRRGGRRGGGNGTEDLRREGILIGSNGEIISRISCSPLVISIPDLYLHTRKLHLTYQFPDHPYPYTYDLEKALATTTTTISISTHSNSHTGSPPSSSSSSSTSPFQTSHLATTAPSHYPNNGIRVKHDIRTSNYAMRDQERWRTQSGNGSLGICDDQREIGGVYTQVRI